jgi:phosphinothricin acetyltransferase
MSTCWEGSSGFRRTVAGSLAVKDILNFVVDQMEAADWEDVRRIYLEGISTGHATFETDAPSWETWSAHHVPGCALVARSDGRVIGWAALSPVSSRHVYSGVAEVTIYVDAELRGKGVGRALMAALIALSEKRGFWTVQAAVFPENKASIALHKKLGFREVGRRERIGQTNGTWRDTVLLERRSKSVGL